MAETGEAERRRKMVRHYDEPGDAHFLAFSCYRRMSLLGKDRSRIWLIESLRAARQEHAFDLWAWSSAADWAGGADVVLKIDRTIPLSTRWPR